MLPVENRSLEEIGCLANDVYHRVIEPQLKPEDHGKFLVMDVDTGRYVLDKSDLAAVERAMVLFPGAQLFTKRVGHRTAYRSGYLRMRARP